MAKDKEKLTAKGLKCLFSGKPTKTAKARFLPGYDAKMKSLLLNIMRGNAEMGDIRSDALPFLKSPEGLVGFRLVGGKLEVTGKFKVAQPRASKKAAAKAAPVKAVKTTKKVKKVKKVKAAAPVATDSEDGWDD